MQGGQTALAPRDIHPPVSHRAQDGRRTYVYSRGGTTITLTRGRTTIKRACMRGRTTTTHTYMQRNDHHTYTCKTTITHVYIGVAGQPSHTYTYTRKTTITHVHGCMAGRPSITHTCKHGRTTITPMRGGMMHLPVAGRLLYGTPMRSKATIIYVHPCAVTPRILVYKSSGGTRHNILYNLHENFEIKLLHHPLSHVSTGI